MLVSDCRKHCLGQASNETVGIISNVRNIEESKVIIIILGYVPTVFVSL